MNRSVFSAPILVALLISVGIPSSDCTAQDDDRKQTRLAGVRLEVPVDRIEIDDGDTVTIDWGENGIETVRILGIDTPEKAAAHNRALEKVSHDVVAFAYAGLHILDVEAARLIKKSFVDN